MRDDGDHQRDKELEIGCEPAIDAHEISVGVRNRIGILTGLLRSYRERFQAERDARRVASLAAVPNALEVKVAVPDHHPASDLTQEAVPALASQVTCQAVTRIVPAAKEMPEQAAGAAPSVTAIDRRRSIRP